MTRLAFPFPPSPALSHGVVTIGGDDCCFALSAREAALRRQRCAVRRRSQQQQQHPQIQMARQREMGRKKKKRRWKRGTAALSRTRCAAFSPSPSPLFHPFLLNTGVSSLSGTIETKKRHEEHVKRKHTIVEEGERNHTHTRRGT
jgi:hypothetical protein